MISVGFYVKAGRQTGYGHIVRCMALADELTMRGCDCCFFGNEEANELAQNKDYKLAPSTFSSLPHIRPAAWIVDLEGGCSPELANRLKERCDVLVILNGVGYPDGDPGRLMADLVFYQGRTHRPYELDWTGFCGEWFEGPKWLILRPEFNEYRAVPGTHDPPRVVIAGGGSDPKNVTQLALDALRGTPYEIRVIIGPANDNALRYDPKQVHTLMDPNMAESLAWADLAIVSYGMTAFECMALGLPVVALSISEDHEKSADLVFVESIGGLRNLGLVDNVRALDISGYVEPYLQWCATYGERAFHYVDGKGAGRVAERIINGLAAVD